MTETRLDALRRMARDRPQDSRLRFGLAVELLNCGQLQEGVEALRAYLDVAEDQGNAWARLGSALAELGRVDEAKAALRRGMDIARSRGHEALAEELLEALEDLG